MLSFEVCQSIRAVLVDLSSVPGLTKRGQEALREASEEVGAVPAEGTFIKIESPGRLRWWTFAGLKRTRPLPIIFRKQASRS